LSHVTPSAGFSPLSLHDALPILGVSDASLLPQCPVPGIAMTEHAGLWQTLCQDADWAGCFGYEPDQQQRGSCDTVVVFLPKARAECELRLALARYLGKPEIGRAHV